MKTIAVALIVALSAAAAPAAAGQHAGHTQEKPKPAPPPAGKPAEPLPPFIPPVTDDDRKAAFPDVEGHAVHDNAVNYFVLFDQLEWQAGSDVSGVNVDTTGWVGRDRDRLWFRAEGDSDNGRLADAEAHVLYGRKFARWWDLVAGVRQDFNPGPSRTWAAVGVQGLAPYWFEMEATFYIGESGRTHARFDVEYELLLTNRLVLQPLVEVDVYGKSDPERGIGAGLSTIDTGLRVRYEIRRELAPYIGVTWNRKFGQTAELAEAAGKDRGGARFVAGLRLWF